MEEKRQGPKIDWVGPIFQPGRKKEPSALFSPAKPAEIPAEDKSAPKAASIQKIYPTGLDIGSSSIKVVQLGLSSDGALEVINLALERLSDPALAAEALKKIVSEHKIEGEVVSSISSFKAQIRRFNLPKMPESEIESALKWEIQQTTAEKIDGVSLNYIVLPEEPEKQDAGKLRLLVITVPKADIFSHLGIIQAAGLVPKAVEVDPLAAYTALNYNENLGPQNAVIFLDLGGEAANLNVIANGVRFSRNLYSTGKYLTNSISEAYSMDFKKAEEVKIGQGLSGDARGCLSSALEKLVLEIDHSFKYFSYSLTGSKVLKFDKVFLSGGTSNLKGLVPFLEEKLNVPVERVNPFKRMRLADAAKQKLAVNLEEDGPNFCVASGLALREV